MSGLALGAALCGMPAGARVCGPLHRLCACPVGTAWRQGTHVL